MEKVGDPERDIRLYLEETIIPLITEEFPEVAADMTIQVMGSYGLGLQDDISASRMTFPY